MGRAIFLYRYRRGGWLGPVVLAAALGGTAALANVGRPMDTTLWEAIVLTEAAGEPYEGKVGVAEVLRNRGWNSQGFVGIRREDLRQFLSRQPERVHAEARRALKQARVGSNLTQCATHFENVERFGVPAWASRMERTVRLGRLTFFRERNQSR